MATTTKYAFPYPTSTDPVNVPSDIQGLANALDALGMFRIVTSSTRPGSPAAGYLIFETDTGKAYVYTGGAWAEISVGGPNAYRICTSGARPTGFTGMMIFETDTGRFLVWNGSAWVRLGGSSTSARTGCIVRRETDTNVNNSVSATVTWENEDLDSDGFITVPSSTITIPSGLDGMYALAVSARWDYASPASTGCSIRVATAGLVYGYHGSPMNANDSVDAGSYQASGCSATVPLAAGDTVQFRVANSSGFSPLVLLQARASVIRLFAF